MKPTLVRAIEIPDLRDRNVKQVLEEIPADRYLYGHLGSQEPNVRELRRRGRRVFRTLNLLHSHPRAANWTTRSFEGFMWQLFEENGLWLRDRGGAFVTFPWYRGPRIYNWAHPLVVERGIVQQVVAKVARSENTGDIWLDQLWPSLRTWMFAEADLRIRDLAEYSHARWLAQLMTLLRAFAHRGRGARYPLCVNGYDDWYGHRNPKLLSTFENADTGHRARHLVRTLERWRKIPGTMISINGAPNDVHVRRVLADWLRYGGVLWAERESTASRAWELKRRRLSRGKIDSELRLKKTGSRKPRLSR